MNGSISLDERQRTARDLTGPAAAVLTALLLANGAALTASELAREWVRYSRPKVQEGLEMLQTYGFVTHHGHQNGWALNINQLPLDLLWQGHSGQFIEQTALSSAGVASGLENANSQTRGLVAPASVDNPVDNLDDEGVKPSGKVSKVDTNCQNFTPLKDKIRSDLNSNSENHLSDLNLNLVCQLLAIDANGQSMLREKGTVDASVLLGWYLDASNWGAHSPRGWALKCTLKGSKPRAEWLEMAGWFLALDADEQQDVLAQDESAHQAIMQEYAHDMAADADYWAVVQR